MQHQKTLAQPSSLSGIGLHSGQPVNMTLHPAPAGSGIVFTRNNSGNVHTVPAFIEHLRPMELCTTIGMNGFQIQTVEHVLSALAGLEIDNACLELDGNEVPAVDGSAAPFVDLIQSAGTLTQNQPRTYLKIVKPLTVGEENRAISVYPSSLSKISYTIDYPHPYIQKQTYEYDCSSSEFTRNIAGARTFAFSKEVELLWSRGLGMGGSLENTLVFSDTGLMNETGLRFSDECVRHKILDLIGDLALLGMPVIGHFVADRAGHYLHGELVKAILDHPESWILLNTSEEDKSSLLKSSQPFLNHSPQAPQPVCSSI